MASMGSYCKAYPIVRFEEFIGWKELSRPLSSAAAAPPPVDGVEIEPHLFLQENYVVTEGIFLDEKIVFDKVTDEWIEFCKQKLKFAVPDYTSSAVAAAQS